MQSKSIPKSNLAIFNTFKTRGDKFTGEAKRQRGIISHLAMEESPDRRTRTSIAHVIAEKNGLLWQNLYSGIFRDLDEVLIPLGIVREAGRLPLRRGPKALQQEGIAYYELTDAGLLVTASLEELEDNRIKLLERYLSNHQSDPDQKLLSEGILLLLKTAPSLVFKILKEYIISYSKGTAKELVPMSVEKMRSVVADKISVERELIEAFTTLPEDRKDTVCEFIRRIS
ncbi:MAG: hypothetical protein ACE5JV_02680 [Nitrososphaerales archaeon]